MLIAWASCRRLEAHLTRLARWRAVFRAGRRIAISTAMMAMTTRSSTKVKPTMTRFIFVITEPLERAVANMKCQKDAILYFFCLTRTVELNGTAMMLAG